MTHPLAAKASAYWRDAQRLERMPEFEAGGLDGPTWAIVYRAVSVELNACAVAAPPAHSDRVRELRRDGFGDW